MDWSLQLAPHSWTETALTTVSTSNQFILFLLEKIQTGAHRRRRLKLNRTYFFKLLLIERNLFKKTAVHE